MSPDFFQNPTLLKQKTPTNRVCQDHYNIKNKFLSFSS